MQQARILGLAVMIIFVTVTAILLKLIPAPRKDSDYLVIGSVATLVSLLVMFVALLATRVKSADPFFKKRKKKRPD